MHCLFCDFVKKLKDKHNNRFSFHVLHETRHTISFLSIDIPEKEDGHVLVIPKKHYSNLEDIPPVILNDLIRHVALTCKVLRRTHEGCNVLLNNGKSAGQYIFHTHFHVIPRNKGDDIKIEIWKRRKITADEFVKLHRKIRKGFERHVSVKNK